MKDTEKCVMCGIRDFETIKKTGKIKKTYFLLDKQFNEYRCFFEGKSIFITFPSYMFDKSQKYMNDYDEKKSKTKL